MNDERPATESGHSNTSADSQLPEIIGVLADESLAQTLTDLAQAAGMRFVRSDTAIDLIACNAAAHVVDPAACHPEDWAAVCQYLQEVAVDEPGDDTPLFLIGCDSAHADCRHDLAKPEGSVQRFGQDAAALVRAFRQWLRLASEARTVAADIATGKERA